jgi:glycosyltransferase involved in cell wall biosynthesis
MCSAPNKSLTIAIPTFNRADLLYQCLSRVLLQARRLPDVDVLVVNNGCTDSTADVLDRFVLDGFSFQVIELPVNEGMAISQYECFVKAKGDYVWILSDDDLITEEAVWVVTQALTAGFDLYSLNYKSASPASAQETICSNTSGSVVPASDLMLRRGIGHMSGLIYRSSVARETLIKILDVLPLRFFNASRGVFGYVSSIIANKSSTTAFHIGAACFSATEQAELDYNGLELLCLGNYRDYHIMRSRNWIGDQEYHYRKTLIKSRLKKSYPKWYPRIDKRTQFHVDIILKPLLEESFILRCVSSVLKLSFIRNFLKIVTPLRRK